MGSVDIRCGIALPFKRQPIGMSHYNYLVASRQKGAGASCLALIVRSPMLCWYNNVLTVNAGPPSPHETP